MFLTFIEGFIEVELMVTKRPTDRRPTDDDDDDRVNIEQSASGRWNGRVLQKQTIWYGMASLTIIITF